MHQAAFGIDADVRLHPEMPLVALLGLVHFRITLAFGVLGRTGRGDDRGVHDAALLEQQSFAREVLVDGGQDVFGQVALFEQMAKIQDRRFVGNRLAQAQVRERSQRCDLVQRLFHRRVAQGEPVLHQVHPQHRLQRIRPASSARNRVVRRDHVQQRLPRHDLFHLFEKHLAPCLLALACVLRVRETQLAHRPCSFRSQRATGRIGGPCSDFP